MEEKDWVLLVKNQTRGPYTKSEVEELLSSGDARYSDYIWGKNLTRWYTIHEFANDKWGEEPPPSQKKETASEENFEVLLQPRERPSLGFIETEPTEAKTENLAYSPMEELVDEIIWDQPEKIIPLRAASRSVAPARLMHLAQSFGFAKNTEKTFLLGWFFVISGLLMLFAFIF